MVLVDACSIMVLTQVLLQLSHARLRLLQTLLTQNRHAAQSAWNTMTKPRNLIDCRQLRSIQESKIERSWNILNVLFVSKFRLQMKIVTSFSCVIIACIFLSRCSWCFLCFSVSCWWCIYLFFVFKCSSVLFILFLPCLQRLGDAHREALIHLTTLSSSLLCMKLCRPAAQFNSSIGHMWLPQI